VILNEIMESIREDSSIPIRFLGVPAAKFLSPLRPGEALVIQIDEDGAGSTSFLCTVGTRIVASGSLSYELATAGPPPSS